MPYYLQIHKNDNIHTRLAKKRFNNNLKRKRIYYKQSRMFALLHNGQTRKINKLKFAYSKEIERFCNTNNHLLGRTPKLRIKLNKDFSLFNNADLVLIQLLQLLRNAQTRKKSPTIIYDGYVSFGALYLIDNMCWEIGKKRKWQVMFHDFPLAYQSILAKLRTLTSSDFEDECEHIINERVIINRKEDRQANQQYKAKATQITNMVEKAIRASTDNPLFELSIEAHMAIKSAIGEQFDNILLHAKETELGTLCGFYNKMTHEVTILIYNFGKTIAETLIDHPLPQAITNKILAVIEEHKKNNLFNFTRKGEFTFENALTLLALQEGISSRIKYDPSRGNGLMDFIGHCFELSADTQIAIISGQTAIKIDKKYPMSERNVFGRSRRVIALNEENDILKKPDPNYIRNLAVRFNGVLIETTIPVKVV